MEEPVLNLWGVTLSLGDWIECLPLLYVCRLGRPTIPPPSSAQQSKLWESSPARFSALTGLVERPLRQSPGGTLAPAQSIHSFPPQSPRLMQGRTHNPTGHMATGENRLSPLWGCSAGRMEAWGCGSRSVSAWRVSSQEWIQLTGGSTAAP